MCGTFRLSFCFGSKGSGVRISPLRPMISLIYKIAEVAGAPELMPRRLRPGEREPPQRVTSRSLWLVPATAFLGRLQVAELKQEKHVVDDLEDAADDERERAE